MNQKIMPNLPLRQSKGGYHKGSGKDYLMIYLFIDNREHSLREARNLYISKGLQPQSAQNDISELVRGGLLRSYERGRYIKRVMLAVA